MGLFNNTELFPTPEAVIIEMLYGYSIEGKVILEPSAGKGNIVDYLTQAGASEVLACEINQDLKKILATKCRVIADDFLTLESHQISHIDMIVMNPPFSADEKHILHAWDIAPEGCHIIALCNANTYKNTYSRERKQFYQIVNENGTFKNLGDAFSESERKTEVEIGLIQIQKPGESYSNEFEGFFMDEDDPDKQENGIMPYNFIRDLVNRYVEAIKIFDQQLDLGVKMNQITSGFYGSSLSFEMTEDKKPVSRNQFKKDLQKAGWKFIFNKMNMNKYATKGLREDINIFVEKQTQIPFTMRNIYRMLEIIVGTQEQRMDKAILEVFDKLTQHYHENRYNVEGWKTNSHYLINEKFILNYIVDDGRWSFSKRDYISLATQSGGNRELIEDMLKAMCYLTGTNYDECTTLYDFFRYRNREFGVWYSWGFFEIRGYKKGTMHFKFNSKELWAQFNQRVAKLKGYPLYESVKTEPKKKTEPEPEPVQETKRTFMPAVQAALF